MTGTIKTLTDRGFGFIAREGEEKDLFFHANNHNVNKD
jgi:cold shock CspA family protein